MYGREVVSCPRMRGGAKDAAELLACSVDTAKKRMDAGDIAYIVERGSDRRRIPYSWVMEYIHRHKKYARPFGKRKEIVQ